MLKSLKLLIVFVLVSSLLMACGNPSIQASYPLESITGQGAQSSKVYRADNKTVPQVAEELSKQNKPQEISKTDSDHMFLVYSDEWDHLQRDPQKTNDTLIKWTAKNLFVKIITLLFWKVLSPVPW